MAKYTFMCAECGPMEIHHSVHEEHPSVCVECGSTEWKQSFKGVVSNMTTEVQLGSAITSGRLKDHRPPDMAKWYEQQAKQHRPSSRAHKWRKYQAEKAYERGIPKDRFASERSRDKRKTV